MTRYALLAALLGVLGLAGALAREVWLRKDAEAESARLSASLATCSARADNITEDKESDNAVDAIPDDGLRDVPDHWMRH